MATKSILKNVTLKDKRSIKKFVRAIENSEKHHESNPTPTLRIKKMDSKTIKKIWG